MLCWNGLNPRSQVILIFSNETEIVEPLKWLRENHILHSKIKLEDNDDTVVYLRDIIEKTKISIQEFWDIPVGNDEWIKNNINEIKTPIFILKEYSNVKKKDKERIDPLVCMRYANAGTAAVVVFWIKDGIRIPIGHIARDLFLMLTKSLEDVRDENLY